MTTTTIPTIANIDDIDKGFAQRAFYGTSFDPAKRGEMRRQEYVEHIQGLYAELWPIAATDEQKAMLADEMERYRQNYLAKYHAYLASHSRIVSTMIAGPANFPSHRMQKYGDWTDKRLNELIEWSKRAQASIKAKLLDSRPDEVKANAEWVNLRTRMLRSLGAIKEIDEGTSPYDRASFVNSIAGRVERLAQNGEVELVEKALAFVREYNENLPKPAISSRHKFWTFADVAKQVAAKREQTTNAENSVIAKGDGFEIVGNAQINRVQIIFDAKPDQAILAKLRGAGWRWSPREGAWQRQWTDAARYSAMQLTGAQNVA